MDLVRSPSRTYVDSYAPQEYYQYSRSAMPSAGIRVRGRDYSGYDTDTGLMTSRGYAPRYYRGQPPPPAPPPPPMYPYYPHYHHHDSQRSMFRPDGYDTDSGLVSSGRVHMTRTLPPRMAVIPETVVVNNRIIPGSNINTLPTSIRTSSFANQSHRGGHATGYETDPGMNTRQYRQVPVDVQYGDSGWVGHQSMSRTNNNNQRYQQTQDQHRSTSIPVFSRQFEQQQQQKRVRRRSSIVFILTLIALHGMFRDNTKHICSNSISSRQSAHHHHLHHRPHRWKQLKKSHLHLQHSFRVLSVSPIQ